MGVDMSQKHTTTMSKNSSNDQRADEIVATMTDLISKLSTVCAMMDFFGWSTAFAARNRFQAGLAALA